MTRAARAPRVTRVAAALLVAAASLAAAVPARAQAPEQLSARAAVEHFTLVKDGGAWKIVNGSYTSKQGAPK